MSSLGSGAKAKTFCHETTNTDFTINEYFTNDILLLKERLKDKDFIINFNEQRIKDLENQLDHFKNRIKSIEQAPQILKYASSKHKRSQADLPTMNAAAMNEVDDGYFDEQNRQVIIDICEILEKFKLNTSAINSNSTNLKTIKELLKDKIEEIVNVNENYQKQLENTTTEKQLLSSEKIETEKRLNETMVSYESLKEKHENAEQIINMLKENEKLLQNKIEEYIMVIDALRNENAEHECCNVKKEVRELAVSVTESLNYIDEVHVYPKHGGMLRIITTLLRFI